MEKFKQYLLATAGLATLVGGLTLLGPAVPQGQAVPPAKDVNVVNTSLNVDATQSGTWEVGITNTAGNPVPVEDVSNQERRGFVLSPQLSAGDVLNPAVSSTHDLVTLVGPGVFISAHALKQGGASDTTDIRLLIDGTLVTGGSPAFLRSIGLTEMNPTGIAVFSNNVGGAANIDTITIGFPVPLIFETSLTLRTVVSASDTGIVQIVATVVNGE